MAIRKDLLNDINAALVGAASGGYKTRAAVSDIYEVYILTLVIKAARAEGAVISYRDANDNPTSKFVFRTGPGFIFPRNPMRRKFTHAVLEFPGKDPLEAHVGIYVAGNSGVLHECDVSVVDLNEAQKCRLLVPAKVAPHARKVLLATECKFYKSGLRLNLARSFVGLTADFSGKPFYFVANTSSALIAGTKRRPRSESIEIFLNERLHAHQWQVAIIPTELRRVDRLQGSFEEMFKKYKTKKR
jgi:hypothetical protein